MGRAGGRWRHITSCYAWFRHNIAEILLKLAFRWLTPSNQSIYSQHCPSSSFLMSHFSSKVVIDLDMCYWFPLTRVYCVLGGYNHSFGQSDDIQIKRKNKEINHILKKGLSIYRLILESHVILYVFWLV
jgi:hypothetical protein